MQHKDDLLINDFYSKKRDYNKRHQLYDTVAAHYNLYTTDILYLEFGVAAAHSFKWWLEKNTNATSSFYGFDTFEGLPEDWGRHFKKGDMSASLPDIDDKRAGFYKGIFQDTLHGFIENNEASLKGKQKVIHMDADLFSSTIFVLSQLHPYLQKGDIIFFDEFNVANHEYQAFRIFTDAFYVKLKPVAAVNNFYQVAFVVE
jgi:O-methyltransferase